MTILSRSVNTRSFDLVVYLFEWLLLLGALGLFTVTEEYNGGVTAGLALLVGFFGIRAVRGNLWPRRTGLEIPLALFVISAATATWIAYNFTTALLQFARILAAVGLFSAVIESSPAVQRWLASGFLLAAAGLGVYWPIQHNFIQEPAKFGPVNALGLWLNHHVPNLTLERLTGPSIHPNVAAGTLALAVPIGIALGWELWSQHQRIIGLVAIFGTLSVLFGLLLTTSRGTWAGLSLAGVGAGLAWVQRRWFSDQTYKIAFWGLLVLVGLAVLFSLLSTGRLEALLGAIPGPSNTVLSRVEMWRQSEGLLRDYVYTGSGLGSFWMVHATYALLIHVPFIAHAHNTFLEVWVEQGVFGAIALIWGGAVILGWFWRAMGRQGIPPLGVAGVVGLASMTAHSMVDVVFYIERTLPLVGLILGYAWIAQDHSNGESEIPNDRRSPVRWYTLSGVVFLSVVGILANYKPLLSAWFSNLGALQQTRIELTHYDPNHFDNPTLDQVRRAIDLSPAQGNFSKALSYEPLNRTALQRLSQISLSQGDYLQAWDWMQTAWKANYRDEVTRLLYADAAAANGFPDLAGQALQGIGWAETRLMGQAWSRYWLGGDFQRALYVSQTVLILDPTNQDAKRMVAQAERKLKP